ncbi:hypothetical protein E2C01_012246 [Portunus trituberculatus]|uniref:Secreted protein n=1 Tax=Portunus trituberculatus TaxID=210409 RepID=A0A5B7DD11_PORTR|nr:hypothetical protein [Portunus trituberculatus]
MWQWHTGFLQPVHLCWVFLSLFLGKCEQRIIGALLSVITIQPGGAALASRLSIPDAFPIRHHVCTSTETLPSTFHQNTIKPMSPSKPIFGVIT